MQLICCPRVFVQGMLCTISSAFEHLDRTERSSTSIHLIGPPGLAHFLNTALQVSMTYICVPLVVHELAGGPVHEQVSCKSGEPVRRCKW